MLQGPVSSRVLGDAVVQDSPETEFHDDEYINDTKSHRDHREEAASHDALGVIAHEVNQRWFGSRCSGLFPRFRYFLTVLAATRIPSFHCNSLAIRSSPQ